MVVPHDVRQEYRKWPGKTRGFRIEMRPGVVAELAASTLEGVKAVPRRGLEISGLFLGEAGAHLRKIESLVPLVSDYPEGPVFRVRLPYVESVINAATRQGRIVGIYRSRTDGVLDVDPQDEMLLQSLKAFAPLAVMVVRQTRSSPAEARTGVWNGAEMEWSEAPVVLKDWLADRAKTGLPLAASARRSSLRMAAAAVIGLVAVVLLWPIAAERRAALSASGRTLKAPRAVFGSSPPPPPPSTAAVTAPKPIVVATEKENTRGRKQIIAKQPKPELSEPPPAIVNRKRPAVYRTPLYSPPPVSSPRSDTTAVAAALPAPPQIATTPAQSLQAVPAPSMRIPQYTAPVTFVGPVLVRQTTPIVIPPALRRFAGDDVVIVLNLTIDASGRVIAVDRAGSLDRAQESLWGVYTRAVRTWRFEPARRNDVPVEAKTVLRFRVTSGQP